MTEPEEIYITVVVRRPPGRAAVDPARWSDAVLRGVRTELARTVSRPPAPAPGPSQVREVVAWTCLALSLFCLAGSAWYLYVALR